MNTKAIVLAPLCAAGLTLACTPANEPEPDFSAEVRVSAAIQADIAGLSAVSLTLTPAQTCGGYWEMLDDDGTPYAFNLDITQMAYPDGSLFETPTDYTHALAETVFESVVPGCYDVVAAPLGSDGEPLAACHSVNVPIVVDDYASAVVDVPVLCGEVPRIELDVTDGNFEPHIDSITAEPMVSACDVTVVCATARDADYDMLEFEWPQPNGVLSGGTAPWPTIVSHTYNPDRSTTQCIAVQARDSGNYDVAVNVYDLYRNEPGLKPVRIEDRTGVDSHASDSVNIDATLGCEATGRSAVILLTLDNEPGMDRSDAATLIGNTLDWIHADAPGSDATSVLVVLDDNHHGEDAADGEYVTDLMMDMNYDVEYMREPAQGLDYNELIDYDIVWFVNPGYEMDDAISHTALLRYRASGGGLVLQGDDIARFRGNPEFMEPLTYLAWQDNGTNACGLHTDNNQGSTYAVKFEIPTSDPHPMATGLEQLSFKYGNDIDLTRPLEKGERVLAWAYVETETCELRTPAVVALEPDDLVAWE